MSTIWAREKLASAIVVLAFLVGGCGGSPMVATPIPSPTPPTFTTSTKPGTYFIGAGDVGECSLPGAGITAGIIEKLRPFSRSPDGSDPRVPVPGDLAYPNGSETDFRDCFVPHWGRFKLFMIAALGNHEYNLPGRPYFFTYFGDEVAGHDGYQSYVFGRWLVLVLNSERRGAAQIEFMRDELATHPESYVLAIWHRPRWSSSRNGDSPYVQEFWNELRGRQAVILNGHDHVYERMYPLGVDGKRDDGGIRQFTVGTGGGPLYEFKTENIRTEISEFRYSDPDGVVREYGVIRLRLAGDGYEWEYWVSQAGKVDPVMVDQGLETFR